MRVGSIQPTPFVEAALTFNWLPPGVGITTPVLEDAGGLFVVGAAELLLSIKLSQRSPEKGTYLAQAILVLFAA